MHGSSDDRRVLRASDAERDAAVDRLRTHGVDGRLTVDELTERIEKALEAKTLGQLDDLFVDLPDDRPSLAAMPPPTSPPAPYGADGPYVSWRRHARLRLLNLAIFNLIFIGLWASSGPHATFWPAWILIISVVVFARRTARLARRAERDARRASRRQTPPPFLDP